MAGPETSTPYCPIHCLRAALLTLALGASLPGCSTGPDGFRSASISGPHQLNDSAKGVRAAYAGPQPLPRELDMRVAPLYTVEPGDVLLVQPGDIDSPARFPADQPVFPDGTINLGQFGLLPVAGKTVPEIEVQTRAQIEAVLNAQTIANEKKDTTGRGGPHDAGPITVRVVTRQSKVYYVLGEVNAPGSFSLKGNETVLDGIVSAGGLAERASWRNIILSRPTPADACRVVLPICYKEIVQTGDTSTNYQLFAGDRIYVPSRSPGEPCGEGKHSKRDSSTCCGPEHPCPGLPPLKPGCGYQATPTIPPVAAPSETP
jgi:polysaccharide export outer membrane protein